MERIIAMNLITVIIMEEYPSHWKMLNLMSYLSSVRSATKTGVGLCKRRKNERLKMCIQQMQMHTKDSNNNGQNIRVILGLYRDNGKENGK